MPSPFPGMDPYLEAPELWPGVHNALAAEIQAMLNARLAPGYVAMLEGHVVYEVIEVNAVRRARPDVAVLHSGLDAAGRSGVAAVMPAPVISEIPVDIAVELFSVEIRRSHMGTLVTVIEILSPANKRPGDQAFEEYRRKRRELLRTDVHVLEVDLLRAGQRPPLARPVPQAPYYVTLSRSERRPNVEVWPIQLADRLPVVPVPLVAPDPDVALDLAAVVASVYERGAYARVLNYGVPPPPPPLSAHEAAWMTTIVPQ